MKFEKNMGAIDRMIRAIIAAVAAVLYFSGAVTGTLGIVLLVVAVIFILTSVFAVCPLYMLFKFSTAKK